VDNVIRARVCVPYVIRLHNSLKLFVSITVQKSSTSKRCGKRYPGIDCTKLIGASCSLARVSSWCVKRRREDCLHKSERRERQREKRDVRSIGEAGTVGMRTISLSRGGWGNIPACVLGVSYRECSGGDVLRGGEAACQL